MSLCFWSFIANAGDARAVLGVQEEDGSFSAHTFSNDHNAQNESEVARIRSEHPPSERKTVIRQVLHSLICSLWLCLQPLLKPRHHIFLLCQERLLGLLMPFRAFGDVKFKWSIELQKRVLESGPDQLHENEHTKFIPPNYHTPPYLTAEPEITYHKLRPQDRFLVRCSGGAVTHPSILFCLSSSGAGAYASCHRCRVNPGQDPGLSVNLTPAAVSYKIHTMCFTSGHLFPGSLIVFPHLSQKYTALQHFENLYVYSHYDQCNIIPILNKALILHWLKGPALVDLKPRINPRRRNWSKELTPGHLFYL